jgi:hypothetical protein
VISASQRSGREKKDFVSRKGAKAAKKKIGTLSLAEAAEHAETEKRIQNTGFRFLIHDSLAFILEP